jgi:hypothetical protein
MGVQVVGVRGLRLTSGFCCYFWKTSGFFRNGRRAECMQFIDFQCFVFISSGWPEKNGVKGSSNWGQQF